MSKARRTSVRVLSGALSHWHLVVALVVGSALGLLTQTETRGQQQYAGQVKFSGIGDYGCLDPDEKGKSPYHGDCYEKQVAKKAVKDFSPEFVITFGDNNYPDGEEDTFGRNLDPYDPLFDTFEPAIGNHGYLCKNNQDCPGKAHVWEFFGTFPCERCDALQPYLKYKYDKSGDPPLIRFFVLDSTPADDDLNSPAADRAKEVWGPTFPGIQQLWLEEQLPLSDACWNVVYFHHSPYTAGGSHPPNVQMQPVSGWLYEEWGADIVFTGHTHNYQRFEENGVFPYIVNGASGGPRVDTGSWPSPPPSGMPERKFHLDEWGANLMVANPKAFVAAFLSVGKDVNNLDPPVNYKDAVYMVKDCNGPRPRDIGGVG